MRRHPRRLFRWRKKRMVRCQAILGHKPPFWFERNQRRVRAAQMQKYRQMRPQPEPPASRGGWDVSTSHWGSTSATSVPLGISHYDVLRVAIV